ncbi:STAS domain-containing protein [Streptomyces sp. NPDC051840]|uniref:STAS domain-containing protein n=1 Tax=Streptomyces sp. NPDC051840 TaxID=3154752 RepID=UPI0034372196
MVDVRYDAVLVREDVVRVVVEGELDVYTAPAYREYLLAQLPEGVHLHLLLDLRGVGYWDSTALGATVAALNVLRGRGGVMAVRGNGHVADVLRITGLSRVIRMVESDEEALELFAAAPCPAGGSGGGSGEVR